MVDSDELLKQRLAMLTVVPPSDELEDAVIQQACKKPSYKEKLRGILAIDWLMPRPAWVLSSVMIMGIFIGWEGDNLYQQVSDDIQIEQSLVGFMYDEDLL